MCHGAASPGENCSRTCGRGPPLFVASFLFPCPPPSQSCANFAKHPFCRGAKIQFQKHTTTLILEEKEKTKELGTKERHDPGQPRWVPWTQGPWELPGKVPRARWVTGAGRCTARRLPGLHSSHSGGARFPSFLLFVSETDGTSPEAEFRGREPNSTSVPVIPGALTQRLALLGGAGSSCHTGTLRGPGVEVAERALTQHGEGRPLPEVAAGRHTEGLPARPCRPPPCACSLLSPSGTCSSHAMRQRDRLPVHTHRVPQPPCAGLHRPRRSREEVPLPRCRHLRTRRSSETTDDRPTQPLVIPSKGGTRFPPLECGLDTVTHFRQVA